MSEVVAFLVGALWIGYYAHRNQVRFEAETSQLRREVTALEAALLVERRQSHPSSRPLRSVPSVPVLRSGGEWER